MLTIALLGPPQTLLNQTPVRSISLKAQGILYYLAASPPGSNLSRLHLASLFWPDSAEREARHSLSDALHQIRRALKDSSPLVAQGETVTWEPGPDGWVDVAALSDVLREAGALNGSLTDSALSRLEAGLALVRGPFLEGFSLSDSAEFDDWLATERQYWQNAYLNGLALLCSGLEVRERWSDVASRARQALRADPFQERFHRLLMEALHATGERAAAVRQYQTCRNLLIEELGVEPEAETTALYRAILRGVVPARVPSPVVKSRPSALPPLIGRDRELARTLGHGPGKILLITGDAGIGKTRLIDAIMAKIAALPGKRVEQAFCGVCFESEHNLPYQPILQILRTSLADVDLQHLPLEPVWLAELGRLLPEINSAAGLDNQAARLAVPLDPSLEQQRLFEAVARYLTALTSDGRRLTLLIEDLHWADEASVQAVGFLVRRLAHEPVRFAASLRVEDMPRGGTLARLLPALETEGRLVRMELTPLSEEQVVDLIRIVSPGENLPELGRRLYQETEGNPLFALEMLRSFKEQGLLDNNARASAMWPLPATVQGIIRARLSRLESSCRDLLAAAAVIGRRFDFNLAWRAGELGEMQALDALDRLLQAGIVREPEQNRREESWRLAYEFSHDKIRQVTYEGLTEARRRALHRRVAQTMANRPHEAGRIAHVAWHFLQAGEREPALRFTLLAAEEAQRVYAYDDVAEAYRQALALIPADPDMMLQRTDILERLGDCYQEALGNAVAAAQTYRQALEIAPPTPDQKTARLWRKLAVSLWTQGDPQETAECFARAEQALPERRGPEFQALRIQQARWHGLRGEIEQALRLCVEVEASGPLAPAEAIQLELARSMAYEQDSHLDDATEAVERALALAKAQSRSKDMAQAHDSLGWFAWRQGNVLRAEEHYQEALTVYQRIGHRPGAASVWYGLAVLWTTQGEWDRAISGHLQSLAIYETIPDLRGSTRAAGSLAVLYAWRGQYSLAWSYMMRARQQAEQLNWDRATVWMRGTAADLAQHAGNLSVAIEELNRILQDCTSADLTMDRVGALTAMASLAAGQGEIHRALSLAREALAVVEESHSIEMIIFAQATMAETYLAAGQPDAALPYADQAVRMAEEAGLRFVVGQAQLTLGQVLLALGHAAAACRTLETAIDRLRHAGARPLLVKALEGYAHALEETGSAETKSAVAEAMALRAALAEEEAALRALANETA